MLNRRVFLITPAALLHGAALDRRAIIQERAAALATFPGQRIEASRSEMADQIAAGTVFFYSRTPVKVGLRNIDWSGGHIKHQEWPAQLNRFFHLSPLASAYLATGDEVYARAARAYIEDWLRKDPYPETRSFRPGDNALTMSIRLGTSVASGWSGTLPVFLRSHAFDDPFLDRIFRSLARQAQFLAARLTAVGNWRISELDALVFLALRFPFLDGARALLENGITGMRNALATQFLPDGVHIERTPGYHDWMTQVAVNYADLARRFPDADAQVDTARTVRSLDYGAQGELFGVNDSMAPHLDPASFSKLERRRSSLAVLHLADRTPPEPPLDQVFPDAGQVFSRTAWKSGADYLAFDASTWGGGHSHLSRLSFAFRSGGRALVADPGILSYEMSDPRAPYGKSTAAHTTLNVDGYNQSGASGQLLRTAFTSDIALIHARYEGGWWKGQYRWNFGQGRGEGIWGEHQRILLWVKKEYLVVVDSLTTDAGHEIRNCWQMGPAEKWAEDAEKLRWWSANRDVNVLLQLGIAPKETTMQCFEGSNEPLRGWVGQHGDDSVAAPLVEFRYPSVLNRPVVAAALLAPWRGTAPPAWRITATGSTANVGHLEIVTPDGATDLLAWTPGLALPIEDSQPFVTDARLVWTRQGTGRRFLLDGTYLK